MIPGPKQLTTGGERQTHFIYSLISGSVPYGGSVKCLDTEEKKRKRKGFGEGLQSLRGGVVVTVYMSVPCSRLSSLKENLFLYSGSSHTPVLNMVSE